MDLDLPSSQEKFDWVEATLASAAEPDEERPKREADKPSAKRALAFAVLGVVCFGFIFGALALRMGRTALLSQVGAPNYADASAARSAMALGKAGMAVHLLIALSALPWLLFMLPFLHG